MALHFAITTAGWDENIVGCAYGPVCVYQRGKSWEMAGKKWEYLGENIFCDGCEKKLKMKGRKISQFQNLIISIKIINYL